MARCNGLVRIINCFSCPSSQVVSSAIGACTALFHSDAQNKRMFRIANGLNALIQVEESWVGKCSVNAAKLITNLLHGGDGGACA